MKPDLKPGDKVSVWGRYCETGKPEILSVKPNGIWVSFIETDFSGKIKITKRRYPYCAILKII